MNKIAQTQPLPKQKFFRIQSVEASAINRKIGVAFFLMSLVPLLVMLYMIFFHSTEFSSDQVKINLKLLAFLSLCASLIGYGITRKISTAVSNVANSAREIVESGQLGKKVEAKDQSEEILNLAKVFNQVTEDLGQKVKNLEHSKFLIQDLLKKIGAIAISGEKIDSLLEVVIESMVKALDAESGVLMILDQEEKQFTSQAAYGKHREALLRLAAKTEGTLGWIIQRQSALVMNQADLNAYVNSQEDLTYHSMVCVPLRYQDQTLGYIAVINKSNQGMFAHDDQILLEHVATQVAVAVENARLNEQAERAYVETIAALAMTVEAKDPYTRGHLQRVSEYSEKVARRMKMSLGDIQTLRDGALLHDIGKIAIKDNILLKPAALTPEETVVMRTHAAMGEKIIAPLHSFKGLREIVRHHQEWYNGSGYPDGLKADQISLGARILSVTDVYDALTTDRPYRKALQHEVAIKMILDESGTHFDPEVVKAFLKVIDDNKPKNSNITA